MILSNKTITDNDDAIINVTFMVDKSVQILKKRKKAHPLSSSLVHLYWT